MPTFRYRTSFCTYKQTHLQDFRYRTRSLQADTSLGIAPAFMPTSSHTFRYRTSSCTYKQTHLQDFRYCTSFCTYKQTHLQVPHPPLYLQADTPSGTAPASVPTSRQAFRCRSSFCNCKQTHLQGFKYRTSFCTYKQTPSGLQELHQLLHLQADTSSITTPPSVPTSSHAFRYRISFCTYKQTQLQVPHQLLYLQADTSSEVPQQLLYLQEDTSSGTAPGSGNTSRHTFHTSYCTYKQTHLLVPHQLL